MSEKIIIATRKSPLALVQTRLARIHLEKGFPGAIFEELQVVTTGDRRRRWSLEKEGGKGLFTKELEIALREGKAHLAVHSAKDLPGLLEPGLEIAGYLPRECPRDVLVLREGCATPAVIATGSPRRRAQAGILFPEAVWTEIRGNVDTRLRKIASGEADATILAAAGLKRLGIESWPGLAFKPFRLEEIVPAVGQGAIAVECRSEEAVRFSPFLDPVTARAVTIERLFLRQLGGGCQTSYGGHFRRDELFVFHEKTGFRKFSFTGLEGEGVEGYIGEIVRELERG